MTFKLKTNVKNIILRNSNKMEEKYKDSRNEDVKKENDNYDNNFEKISV